MTAARFAAALAPDYKAVARMVGYTLHLGRGSDLGPYRGLAVVLRSKLTPGERQGLAWASLMACDDAEALGIAEAVLGPAAGAYGPPGASFRGLMDEADFWAGMASEAELRAYASVCTTRLGARRAA